MTLQKYFRSLFFVLIAVVLTSCGTGSRSANSSNFAAPVPQKPANTAQGSHYGMTTAPLNSELHDSEQRDSEQHDPQQLDREQLTDDAPTNAGAKFLGCWEKQAGLWYQAVDVSVTNPGKYPFNAKLYYGTTCDPSTQADQFGFGQEIQFGGFGYIFWFDAFANKTDMSATWQVGTDTSKCVNYKIAKPCP